MPAKAKPERISIVRMARRWNNDVRKLHFLYFFPQLYSAKTILAIPGAEFIGAKLNCPYNYNVPLKVLSSLSELLSRLIIFALHTESCLFLTLFRPVP